jgi:hypothetical protein
MFSRILAILSFLSVVGLAILLTLTTPNQVGPVGVLVFFALIYIISLGIFVGLVYLFSSASTFLFKKSISTRPVKRLSTKKLYYVSSILAFAPVLLLAIQSFGGIGFLELALVLLFETIGVFLILKR